MAAWLSLLKYDPVRPLIDSDDEAVAYFASRDLLGEETGPVSLV
jgi:hypothetical protein